MEHTAKNILVTTRKQLLRIGMYLEIVLADLDGIGIKDVEILETNEDFEDK